MCELADNSLPPELRDRCRFCAAELPAQAEQCPECGRSVEDELIVRPRRPVWVRVLAAAILLMGLLGLVAWVVHMVSLWQG